MLPGSALELSAAMLMPVLVKQSRVICIFVVKLNVKVLQSGQTLVIALFTHVYSDLQSPKWSLIETSYCVHGIAACSSGLESVEDPHVISSRRATSKSPISSVTGEAERHVVKRCVYQ